MPMVTVTELIIQAQGTALQAAKDYITALEEELGNQGVDCLDGKALRQKWADAQQNIFRAHRGEPPITDEDIREGRAIQLKFEIQAEETPE